MGLIDEAIALEKRAEANYRGAAEETSDAGAAKILRMLADEEARHADALRTMDVGDLEETPRFIDAGMEWIGAAVEGGAAAVSPDASIHDVLQRAMEIERATEAFYRDRGTTAGDAGIAALFTRLAEIEKTHVLFVGSLVEYFDRPTEWIESAEFGLRDEY